MKAQICTWLNTRPSGVPFLWSTLVVAVLVICAPVQSSGSHVDLNFGPQPSILHMSQTHPH